MTIASYIKTRFSYVGNQTDEGASSFAIELGYDPTAETTTDTEKVIMKQVDEWVDKYLLRPTSISESGFSQSWSAEQIKNHAVMMMKRYGITPNDDTNKLLGMNTIIEVTNCW